MAFYVEFGVNYTKFNVSAQDYSVSGEDVEVCFENSTDFYDAEVYVTDYLKKTVRAWPTIPNVGQLTPSVTNESLYNSPNGFTTKFYQNGSNVNQWCLKSSNFGKFFE